MIDVYSGMNTNKQEKMMSEIKLGDTVKRVIGKHGGMRVGDVATVSRIHPSKERVKLKEFMCMHDTKNLEVITKTTADEAEKWTHVDDDGDKCFIVHTKGGLAWVIYERAICDCVVPFPLKDLKPIKPKLSKAQAWDLIQDYEGLDGLVRYILRLHEQYDII